MSPAPARGAEDDDTPRVVVEITERALAVRPADLLSLAFMPPLRPDVVELDLRLVQQRADSAVAEIVNAVNAYARAPARWCSRRASRTSTT